MSDILTSPEDAEEAFYEAISRADLDALMNLWAEDEEIVCIHPGGQPLHGHHLITRGIDRWRVPLPAWHRYHIFTRWLDRGR